MASRAMLNEDVTTQLLRTAVLTGLPDDRFFANFTARRRRELVYHLEASSDHLSMRISISGSGSMTARLGMTGVVIDQGRIERHGDMQPMSWADTGEEARLATALDHNHLVGRPDAATVLSAFIDAIGIRRNAVCSGGFAQWRRTMQLMTGRVARERGRAVEVVATPPMPSPEAGHMHRTDYTTVEICDVSDVDMPVVLKGYEREFREIDEAMTPEAMALMLLAPGYLVRRRHREIFHAG